MKEESNVIGLFRIVEIQRNPETMTDDEHKAIKDTFCRNTANDLLIKRTALKLLKESSTLEGIKPVIEYLIKKNEFKGF